jgi:hypothetical protein
LLGRVFGSGGKSSIRAGFSLGYDYIFDNLYILSNPPQAQQTIDIEGAAETPGFLANGGIRNIPTPITSAPSISKPDSARLLIRLATLCNCRTLTIWISQCSRTSGFEK